MSWLSGWLKRKQITVDHTQVAGTIADFRVQALIDLSTIPTAKIDGSDIVLSTDDVAYTEVYAIRQLTKTLVSTSSTTGAWTWYNDPRAVYYNGAIYYGYISTTGDVIIEKTVLDGGTCTSFTLSAAFEVDDHDNPAIHFLPDGKVVAFYCKHSTSGAKITYRISTNAEDISAWGNAQTINYDSAPLGWAYVNPFYLSSENKVYMLSRGPNWKPHFTSSADCSTWATPVKMIDDGGGDTERPYVKYCSDGVSKIHMALSNDHPRNSLTSIYHCYYEAGSFYKTDGTLIKTVVECATTPLTTADMTLVYDATSDTYRAWPWDVALDETGKPVILFAKCGAEYTTVHQYKYARWSGSAWAITAITDDGGPGLYADEDQYSGGMCLDHTNVNRVYYSANISGQWEVWQGVTSDNGATWQTAMITSGSTTKILRPFVPYNMPAASRYVLVLDGAYTTYLNYALNIKLYSVAEQLLLTFPIDVNASADAIANLYYENAAHTNNADYATEFPNLLRNVDLSNNDRRAFKTPVGAAGSPVGTLAIDSSGVLNTTKDNYISLGTDAGVSDAANLRVSAWVKFSGNARAAADMIVSNWLTTADKNLMFRYDSTTGKVQGYAINAAATQVGGSFTDLALDTNWHKLSLVYTGAALECYKDSTKSATTFALTGNLDSSSDIFIGHSPHNAAALEDGFRGIIKKVIIENIARGQAWETTEYNNDVNIATFATYGDEETPPVAPATSTPARRGMIFKYGGFKIKKFGF